MPQFCILFYANYTILSTQRGGTMAQWPPPKYAPAGNLKQIVFLVLVHSAVILNFWCNSFLQYSATESLDIYLLSARNNLTE